MPIIKKKNKIINFEPSIGKKPGKEKSLVKIFLTQLLKTRED